MGPQADQVAGEIRAALAAPAAAPARDWAAVARQLIAALPGADFRGAEVRDSRLRISLPATAAVDEAALVRAGLRGVFRSGDRLHLLVGPGAGELANAFARLG